MGRWCKFFRECKKPAAYRIPHSQLALCADHFTQNVEKRVAKFIEKKKMMKPERGDKILVALSGGKDSQTLLTILKKLFPDPETLPIEGLYVELGIADGNYSSDSGKIAAKLCKELDVPFHTINVREKYRFNIDDIHRLKAEYRENEWDLGKFHFRGECAYCGAFKRYVLNEFAVKGGFTKVVTGHNLTDESTALLNNFFNVELMFLRRSGPRNDSDNVSLVPRVKPLFYISEEEIMMYTYYNNIDHLPTECPYSLNSPNVKIKKILQEVEGYRRGNMISWMRRYQKVMRPILDDAVGEYHRSDRLCNRCGMPTLKKTCSFCKMMGSLTQRFTHAEEQLNEKIMGELSVQESETAPTDGTD